jgi:hypothetical protein
MIRFRPHHFLCTFCFQGKGYSSTFVRNYQRLVDKLHDPEGDQVIVEVVTETDDICTPCPHKRDALCATQDKIAQLDHAHAAALHLKPGDRLTWGEAKQRIQRYMTLEVFHTACAGCEWKKLGICEAKITASTSK